MTIERCERCFGQIMNGKCACGKYTTVETKLYSIKEFEMIQKLRIEEMENGNTTNTKD